MKEIKKLGILSLGKIAAALYFIFGILSAIFVLIIKQIITKLPIPNEAIQNLAAFEQLTIGRLIYSIILQTIIAFIAGILVAFLYNLLAKKIGGIKIEI